MTNPLRRTTPEALKEFDEISSTTPAPSRIPTLQRKLARMTDEAFKRFKEKQDRINEEGMSDKELQDMDDIIRADSNKPKAIKKNLSKKPSGFVPSLRKKLAFLEPTTTFSNSFRKKKHKIPKIKTSRVKGIPNQLDITPRVQIDLNDPLAKKVPQRSKEGLPIVPIDRRSRTSDFPFKKTTRGIRPKKPKQKDFQFIINAKQRIALSPEDRKQKLRDFKQTKQFIENAGEGDEFQREDRMKQEEEFIGTGRRIRPTGGSMETSFNLRRLNARLGKMYHAIVRIPRKEHRESRATRINFTQKFVEKSKDVVKGQNIVPESKALDKFIDKGELINIKTPGANKLDPKIRGRLAVKIRSTEPRKLRPIRDEMGNLIPKNKRQLSQIKIQQDKIRKQLGIGAKGIYCTPCTRKAIMQMKVKIAQTRNTPADTIVSKFETFLNKKPSFKGKSGVFDPETLKILDANKPGDSKRLQKLFGDKDKKIGFNSITDTRKGPETNIGKIRSQLRKIEKRGGTPALGFDEGSLEAVQISRGKSDRNILTDLEPSQRSTGILTPKKKFKIVNNPNFKQ